MKSPLLLTRQGAKTQALSLVGSTADKPEERRHNRVDRPDRVADTGAETCEQNWRRSMRRCVRQLKRSARRHAVQLLGPSDAERRAHEIHHMPYRSWCEYCVGRRGKQSPHLSRYEQADEGIQVVQMDYTFLHDTGDKDAKVTFLTMVDNSSGQVVATAVQKKGHDKFVERLLLKGLESFGVTGEMVLQTGPIRCGKTRGS